MRPTAVLFVLFLIGSWQTYASTSGDLEAFYKPSVGGPNDGYNSEDDRRDFSRVTFLRQPRDTMPVLYRLSMMTTCFAVGSICCQIAADYASTPEGKLLAASLYRGANNGTGIFGLATLATLAWENLWPKRTKLRIVRRDS